MVEFRWSRHQIEQFCDDVFDTLMQDIREQEEREQARKPSREEEEGGDAYDPR